MRILPNEVKIIVLSTKTWGSLSPLSAQLSSRGATIVEDLTSRPCCSFHFMNQSWWNFAKLFTWTVSCDHFVNYTYDSILVRMFTWKISKQSSKLVQVDLSIYSKDLILLYNYNHSKCNPKFSRPRLVRIKARNVSRKVKD